MSQLASQQSLDSLKLPGPEAVDASTPGQQPQPATQETLFATAAKIEAELKQQDEIAHEKSTTIEGVQAKADALGREKAIQEVFAKLGEKHVDDMHAKSELVGKWSYNQLSGNKGEFQRAIAKGEPEVDDRYNPDYKRISQPVGYGRLQSLSDDRFDQTRVEKPLDYVKICMRDIDISAAKFVGAPDAPKLKDFISKEGEQSVRVKSDTKDYDVKVKDLPPDVAYALFMQQYNGKDPVYQAEHNRVLAKETETSLKSFSDTALKEGDLTTAIEGYVTLGKMSEFSVVSALTQKMESMQIELQDYRQRGLLGEPEEIARINEKQMQLQRAARRLDEYRLSGK